MTEFQWPWEYSFPPFFTLQPHEKTQKQQLNVWSDLFLKYFKHSNKFIVNVYDNTSPLYCNNTLDRRLSPTMILLILEKLQSEGHAQPLDKSCKEWLIYWHTLEEYGNLIYEWIQETGQVNTVCTLYEIANGENSSVRDFHNIDESVLIKVLQLLEEKGKCELIELGDTHGNKFSNAENMNEINKKHMKALQHAAEISPLIKERTIGPVIGPSTPVNEQNKNPNKSSIQKSVKKKKNKEIISSQNCISSQPKIPLDIKELSTTLLLKEYEKERKRSVHQQILDLQDRHNSLMHQRLKPIEQKMLVERHKWLEKKLESDSRIIELAEQESVKELQHNEQQLDAIRKQTQCQLQLISFQAISQYQIKFRSKYERIVNLLLCIDKQSLLSCAEYNCRLKKFVQMFDQLISNIKSGNCGLNELKSAENLSNSLHELEMNIMEACRLEQTRRNEQKKEEEQVNLNNYKQTEKQDTTGTTMTVIPLEVPSENSNLLQTEKTILTQVDNYSAEKNPATISTVINQMVDTRFVSVERYEFYTQINKFYQEKVERVRVLQSDETMKKYRSECQKAINIPINAISAVNREHMKDKFDKLLNFVCNQTDLARDYCILLMAKKFVGQGETTISSNPHAAFAVASVVVSLWKHIPEFGQLFLAYIFKESPFLVPYFIPQKNNETWEQYAKVLGYRINNGQIEQQDIYLKRQAGVARLYAAVLITNGCQKDGPMHPYGLQNAWRWLTNFLNLTPLPDICATLIMEVLQIVGNDMWLIYGKQFTKILIYIQQYYFPKLSQVDEGGPKVRLELILSKFLKEGQIKKPQGILSKDFW